MESLPLMTVLTLHSDKFPQSPHVKRNSNQSGRVASRSCDSGTSHFLSVWQDRTLQMPLPDIKTS